jgi:hypothetical protein
MASLEHFRYIFDMVVVIVHSAAAWNPYSSCWKRMLTITGSDVEAYADVLYEGSSPSSPMRCR